MQLAQSDTMVFPPKHQKVNFYRHAEIFSEITIGFAPSSLFASGLTQKLSTDMAERENLLVDMLVKAAIISHSDASSALSASPELSVIDDLKKFCHKSEETCIAFSHLLEKVWCGKMTLDEAAVAANHLYSANASVAEAIRLVKCGRSFDS